jgi:hypothetical protein
MCFRTWTADACLGQTRPAGQILAGTAATSAKVCFLIFLVLFVISLLSGRKR